MPSPKVSVVIPAYNEEKYIEKTLQAVLAQDYPNFEVIVVDNGSTDRTSDVVRKFDNVILLSCNEIGALKARITGYKHASGEIIAAIDADCLPEVNWMKKALKHLINKKNVAVSGPYDFYEIPHTNKFAMFMQIHLWGVVNFFANILKLGGVLVGGNSVFRKEAVVASNYFGDSRHIEFYGDDTFMAKKLRKYGRTVYDTDLIMRTSARRYYAIGFGTTNFIYIINFFSVLFFNKPFTTNKKLAKIVR